MGKGGGGPSYEQVMAGERELMHEQAGLMSSQAQEAEERSAARREEERLAELERRRNAEQERAAHMADEEAREQAVIAESEGGATDGDALDLDAVQIERPGYEGDAFDIRPE